jgi:hypothetical protein
VCTNGEGRIWGVDFTKTPSSCAVNTVGCITPLTFAPFNTTTGYFVPGAADSTVAGQVIPGVVLQVTTPCSTSTSATDTFAGGSYSQLSMTSSAQPTLTYLTNKLNASSTSATATSNNVNVPIPNYSTGVDSWAAIVE